MFEHCTVEWYWAPASNQDPSQFQPSFIIFRANAQPERRLGYSVEVTTALTELGHQGYEVVACVASANWLLWTLKRRVG